MSDTRPSVVRLSPILVVNADVDAAADLARQLQIRGCPADVAISCTAAKAATHAKHYGSLILVADLSRASDLACLASLRSRLPATWIIVIGAGVAEDWQNATVRHCADALLMQPFSLDDLMLRLAAFAHRPRPR